MLDVLFVLEVSGMSGYLFDKDNVEWKGKSLGQLFSKKRCVFRPNCSPGKQLPSRIQTEYIFYIFFLESNKS